MAVTHQGTYVQLPKITPAAFTNADAANTKKTIATAGADGSKVVGVMSSSTDTSARLGQLWLTRAAVSYLLSSTSVPALAGSDGVVATANLMTTTVWPGLPTDNDGQRYLFLESGDTLQVSFTTQVTAAKEVDVVAVFGNF